MPPEETSDQPSTPDSRFRPPHEQLLLELTDQAYQQWRHHPVTAAYLLFLGDQREAFRTAAADLLEAGQLEPKAGVLQGRMLTLRELQSLPLDAIQNFYRQEDIKEGDDAAAPDQGHSR